MTPFDSWYSSTIAPIHEVVLEKMPPSVREDMRKASREQMAACWNAALDALINDKRPYRVESNQPLKIFSITDGQIENLRARVIP